VRVRGIFILLLTLYLILLLIVEIFDKI